MNQHNMHMDIPMQKPNEIQVSKDFITRIMYEENKQTGTVDNSVSRQQTVQHCQTPNKCMQCPTAATMLETFLQMHTTATHSHTDPTPTNQSCEVHEKKKHKKKSSPKSTVISTNNGLFCKQCMIAASSLNALILHMVDHTPNKEPNMCGNCDYQTKNRGNFKRHVMTHVNIRPFKCTLCPFSASQKTHLIKHFKYHGHSGCFLCEHCSYGCSDKANFNRHKNLHVQHPASAAVMISAPQDKGGQFGSDKGGQFTTSSMLASAVPLLNYQPQGQNLNSMAHSS